MPAYDADFEALRLRMLADQHREVLSQSGEIIFKSDDANRLFVTRFLVEDERYAQMSASGFKLHMMGLLDSLIEYRSQVNQQPWQEGKVHIEAGQLSIEWLPEGATEISIT